MALESGEVISLTRSASRAADDAKHALGLIVKCLEETGSDLSEDARNVRSRMLELEEGIRRQLLAFEDARSIVRWV